MSRVLGLLAAVILVGAPVACGHSVTSRPPYDDPSRIPLPEDLGVFPAQGSVNVTWFAEPDIFAVIDGWNVYRAVGDEPTDADYQRLNADLFIEKEFVDPTVQDGVRYWYRVTSVTPAQVESVPTMAVSVVVDFTPPPAPQNVVAVAGEAGGSPFVRVTWDEVDDPELRHYNLVRDPPDPLLPVASGLLSPEYLDTRVDRGQRYVYRVFAVDNNLNQSTASDSAQVTVPE